ncbi:DUF3108 domain-containing protein [Shewanella surugensis]|uniref:DUF3108 domain-containing protein n=1 Tax=Shewanella surugensis TaxID=212020 RepID=A0ABT0LDC2_9GAMM|nr:DUF3108 domain-containing protein [Shewanella surugensis]MCL1125490.1 DUF3108 domain-containing protein [Shewanella surugensis]
MTHFLPVLSLFLISHLAQAEIPPLTPLTPQTAEYQVNYGSIELGKARYQLLPKQGDIYQYRFDSDVSLLVLWDKRHIVSEFTLQDGNLAPIRYTHDRTGTGSDYQDQTVFLKDKQEIFSRYKDKKIKLPYKERIYDPLVAQLQIRLDLSKNKNSLEYNMVKEGEIDDYKFKVVGREKIKVVGGVYDTIKIEVVRDSKKRQTFFWMAPSLAYLPIRLTHFEKGSKQLDIQLLKYKFSPELTTETKTQSAPSQPTPVTQKPK